MAPLLTACIVFSTLAFGAVYPWGYWPLFLVAAGVGVAGIVRRVPTSRPRWLIAGVIVVVAAAAVQLMPVSRQTLERLSPHAAALLNDYSLTFANGTDGGRHPLSIDPQKTSLAWWSLLCLGVYVVGLPRLLSASALRRFPTHLIIFSVVLGIFSIMQHQTANGLVYWFWHPHEGDGTNAFGPFVNRNHFAGWMVMSTSLALGYLLGRFERRCQTLQPSSWHERAMWFASQEANTLLGAASAVVVMAIALMWPLSRSAIISFAVALACFSYLSITRRELRVAHRAFAGGALALVLAAAAYWRGPARILAWFGDTADAQSRLAAWADGWRVFGDFALTGTGLNTYGTSMIFYQRSLPLFHLGSAHNDYLQLLVEGGLLVTVPALVAAGILTYMIWRNIAASSRESRGYWIRAGAAVGLVAMAAQEAVEFSLQIPANAFLFCTLAAIALTPVSQQAAVEIADLQQ